MVFTPGKSGNPTGRPRRKSIPEDIVKTLRAKVGKPVTATEMRDSIRMLAFKLVVDALDDRDIRPYAIILRYFPIEPVDLQELAAYMDKMRENIFARIRKGLTDREWSPQQVKEFEDWLRSAGD